MFADCGLDRDELDRGRRGTWLAVMVTVLEMGVGGMWSGVSRETKNITLK